MGKWEINILKRIKENYKTVFIILSHLYVKANLWVQKKLWVYKPDFKSGKIVGTTHAFED